MAQLEGTGSGLQEKLATTASASVSTGVASRRSRKNAKTSTGSDQKQKKTKSSLPPPNRRDTLDLGRNWIDFVRDIWDTDVTFCKRRDGRTVIVMPPGISYCPTCGKLCLAEDLRHPSTVTGKALCIYCESDSN